MQDVRSKVNAAYQQNKEDAWATGARVIANAQLAHLRANDVTDAELEKKEAYAVFERALGVDIRALMKNSTSFGFAQSLPKIMFLFIIVGCELDYYGFIMAFTTYWKIGLAPLRLILITGPVGYGLAIAMLLAYSYSSEDKNASAKKSTRVAPIGTNPVRPDALGRDVEADLPVLVYDSKEPIDLKYYHFMPLFRYYLVIKDGNPSDVEGLFRVNSLSSFTLGIAQISGMVFLSVTGAPFDIFAKINVASQAINWFITFLYFSTSIAKRMKASFKVDTLLYNSSAALRSEYESYLNCTQEAAQAGGGAERKETLNRFHDSLNFEISEFVRQEIDLDVFSMEEKYLMRQAIRKKMYSTYIKIK